MGNMSAQDTKIHILYLVKNAPGVSYQMLLDKCMESLYIDFFTFCQVYDELIAGNLMDRESLDTGTGEVVGVNETLKITKGGQAILEDVEDTLNLKVLGYLKKAAEELRAAVEQTNAVTAFASPSDKGDGTYVVTLCSDIEGKEFHGTFKVPSRDIAETVCRKWRSNSSGVISRFMDELLKM